MGKYVFGVEKDKMFMNGKAFIPRGLRCSNALMSEQSTAELIKWLPEYARAGLNAVSVFFMGNRFGDIKGYNEDASINPVYAGRMARVIRAADENGMLVIVGCLYWGDSKAKWNAWTQREMNAAVQNTVRWLGENDFRNVFLDVDNEGMAQQQKVCDDRALIAAAKAADPSFLVASNFMGPVPDEADLGIHFADKNSGKPYIESEGVAERAPGGYWHRWSRKIADESNYRVDLNYYNYINVGLYTDEMKKDQIQTAKRHFDQGFGYMLASTWLQAVAPFGPHHAPGGSGAEGDPGIRWWIDFIRAEYGSCRG